MAKEKNRGNREVRKPKANKAPAAGPTTSLLDKANPPKPKPTPKSKA